MGEFTVLPLKKIMKNIRDFIEQNNCDYVDTTSEANGYPRNLNNAIVSDSFKELEKLKEQAESDGFDCEFIKIHKRDGWDLWTRDGYELDNSWCKIVGDQDYTVDIDTYLDEDERFKQAISLFYEDVKALSDSISECDDFKSAIELIENLKTNTQNIVDEAGENNGNVTVFYDMNNDSVDYIISDDAIGYSHDTHTYQIALVMEDKCENEDE